jgi:hypothetical protein
MPKLNAHKKNCLWETEMSSLSKIKYKSVPLHTMEAVGGEEL